MTLHLVKLCVGAESVADLRDWIAERGDQQLADGRVPEHAHTTRMVPKRRDDILDGGSLYWVIKGAVQVRQRILDLRPFKGSDGIGRCDIVLDRDLVETVRQPRRPFQGWRYLEPKDAPRDVAAVASEGDELPPALRAELAELGLL
ncbi:hypothetical protein SAMN02745172_02520 [Pseudoxanthobacter soli DSM 19599]|uniref:Lysophospholipase n=1 Tax=Pseudoxanthobacter soli DSM 19599 TaxID=1123029 RepID=A0A1M7ZM35_9HYPH|nr:DUF1489 family protein [Pseudoxanthobacter soli]SHO65872.1 hypothetical protein SAMN02745172_02520 [Pseudoxanthobacter soli DSM 19599]